MRQIVGRGARHRRSTKIDLIEGDTALTPDQGRTAGSTGIQRGGMQIRQAAATARKALIELAAPEAQHAGRRSRRHRWRGASEGGRRGRDIRRSASAGKKFDLKLDPKAPLKDPATTHSSASRCRGRTYRRRCTGSPRLHARFHACRACCMAASSGRRRSARRSCRSMNRRSRISPACKVVRIKDFLGVVAEDEWTCVRAHARAEGAMERVATACRRRPSLTDVAAQHGRYHRRDAAQQGHAGGTLPAGAKTLKADAISGRCRATPRSARPARSPTCAPTRRRSGPRRRGRMAIATSFARILGLPRDKVRLIYLDGSGCYGMNGHDDAAADAAILSRAVGTSGARAMDARGRARLGSEGPAAAARYRRRASIPTASIVDWRTEMWLPQGDARPAEHSAARPGRGRHRPAARASAPA